jgi:hypothetical protein
MKKVFVVTCPELGWDCVVGVFAKDIVSENDLREQFPESSYVIQVHTVELTVQDY